MKRKNKLVILPYFYVVYQQFSLTEPKIKVSGREWIGIFSAIAGAILLK